MSSESRNLEARTFSGLPGAASPTLARRNTNERLIAILLAVLTWGGVAILMVLLGHIVHEGYKYITPHFFTNFASRKAEIAGFKAAIIGSLYMIGLTILLAIPIGVAAAVFLEEYLRKSRLARFIELNINNLAGVPSIVYGILGLMLFVRFFNFQESVLSAACTMALLILPVIIISAREAIRAVPAGIRHAAFAVGATRWQVVSHHVLPAATPGIVTGVILAVSRAIGESAPLLLIGAAAFIRFAPKSPMDRYTVMPVQIFSWLTKPQEAFHQVAAAGIIVLLVLLLALNAVAVIIRMKAEAKYKW
ncbi:phosphate ABC transporter permease PstA [bacterium]|nr:phosphate ABC transporter permease PstA [bacterium]